MGYFENEFVFFLTSGLSFATATLWTKAFTQSVDHYSKSSPYKIIQNQYLVALVFTTVAVLALWGIARLTRGQDPPTSPPPAPSPSNPFGGVKEDSLEPSSSFPPPPAPKHPQFPVRF